MSTVTAVVTLKIRVKVRDTWGEDCPMGQVLKQAREAALTAVNNEAWQQRMRGDELQLIGEPEIEIKTVKP